jgi:hypothetical protein
VSPSREEARRATFASIDALLAAGGEADDLLRQIVRRLTETLYDSAAIAFVEGGELAVGPTSGPEPSAPHTVPVLYQGTRIAELQVAPPHDGDEAFLERVACRISELCLVGWDTGGVPWKDL